MIGDTIAKNINALRKQKGLTQGELAGHIHYSDKVISKWERGESVPDIEALTALADFYGVSLDSIVKDAELAAHTKNKEAKNNAGTIETQPDKAAWEAGQKAKQKKLILQGARIASLIILPLLMNLLYLLQDELFASEFLSSQFYFLSVIPAVLLANFIISLVVKRTFNSTEVLFLLFAFIWTAGIVIIYTMWHLGVIAPGSQRMRIWYILLFYNIIVAAVIVLTGVCVKKLAKRNEGIIVNQNKE